MAEFTSKQNAHEMFRYKCRCWTLFWTTNSDVEHKTGGEKINDCRLVSDQNYQTWTVWTMAIIYKPFGKHLERPRFPKIQIFPFWSNPSRLRSQFEYGFIINAWSLTRLSTRPMRPITSRASVAFSHHTSKGGDVISNRGMDTGADPPPGSFRRDWTWTFVEFPKSNANEDWSSSERWFCRWKRRLVERGGSDGLVYADWKAMGTRIKASRSIATAGQTLRWMSYSSRRPHQVLLRSVNRNLRLQ